MKSLAPIKRLHYSFSKPIFFRKRTYKEKMLLKEHPIFRDIDICLTAQIDSLDIHSPNKKAMASTYLRVYFTEVMNFYNDLCDNYDNYANHPHTMYRNLHSVIGTTNTKAAMEYVPTLFLDKMSVRFYKHIDLLSQAIITSSINRSYSTEFEQTSSILDMSLLFLKMEIDTIESTINNMNGELEELLKGTVFDVSL